MNQNQTNPFDSLFDIEYENTQPLRTYEPLIRVDLNGKPLPRRLLCHEPQQPVQQISAPERKPQAKPQSEPQPQTFNNKKRSPPENNESKLEPKKKQPKGQSKITSFFNKS